jgi:hypothetical protein
MLLFIPGFVFNIWKHFVIKNSTTSRWPFIAAKCNGIFIPQSFFYTYAPFKTKILTTFKCPFAVAKCNAISYSPFSISIHPRTKSIEFPLRRFLMVLTRWINNSTTPQYPISISKCKGVFSLPSCLYTPETFITKNCTLSKCPIIMAENYDICCFWIIEADICCETWMGVIVLTKPIIEDCLV